MTKRKRETSTAILIVSIFYSHLLRNFIYRFFLFLVFILYRLDNSILETVREQSTSGAVAAKDIADAKDSIGDLQAKIIEIKKKAEASEQMVQDICKDIRQLDIAKRHLTNTILTLARLKTLTSAVQQLQGHIGRRSYEEAAPLLEASIQLFTHFADYARVPKIAELAGAVEAVRGELREMITEDFDILMDSATPMDLSFQDSKLSSSNEEKVLTFDELKSGNLGNNEDENGPRVLSDDNVQTLRAACECVDALGPTIRKSLLKSFNRKQLKGYLRIFMKESDIGNSLDGLDKRYAWFRKSLGLIEDKYGRILPKRWRVLHRLSIEFCEITRTDVDRILGQFDPPSSAPPEVLLRALLKTIAFEKEMSKRFESDLSGSGSSNASSSSAPTWGTTTEDEEEVWDDSAPLYNDKGELVDPTTAEGIRLKYKRKKEFEERKLKEGERKAARAEQRRVIASLAGVDTKDAASGKPVGVGRATLDEEIAALPKLAAPGEGMISAAFKPYMTSYVKFERNNIDNAVSATAAEDASNKTDSAAAHASVLRSATQLFAQARNAVTRCVQLSTGQTLFELYKEIADAMGNYSNGLVERMPKAAIPNAAALPGDTYTINENEAPKIVDAICLVINTSEYCAETVPKFAESVQKVLDNAYKEHVNPEVTQEIFFGLTANALKILSGVVACMLDNPLTKLSRTDWSKLTEVGDQSSYVVEMQRAIKLVFPIVRKRLDDVLFRQFCDKFVRAFLVRYQAAIYRCKRIGEMGAQQLLLDAQALRTMLLTAPSIKPASDKQLLAIATDKPVEEEDDNSNDSNENVPPPAVYAKFVQKEVPRVELLLKIISTPRERFADTIKALWAEASEGELTRVMDLKAMNKKDQTDVLVALGRVKPGAVTATLGGMTMSMNLGNFTMNTGSSSNTNTGTSSTAGNVTTTTGTSSSSTTTAASTTANNSSFATTAAKVGGMSKMVNLFTSKK